ncbi:TIGR00341 family protein [Thiomicrospira sp. WB1]|uniref:TIGR00341 family protein n=1 Tax=Thiomicrospira sp. WB1 TaxID=1685380 RepID=UPI0007490A96|nr:TIGR00341 family protein [Thiomicrospira sp. WB1]KUJ72327.1 hypothetical protein AVO41_00475 [Thiomicrospira sp. WB1]
MSSTTLIYDATQKNVFDTDILPKLTAFLGESFALTPLAYEGQSLADWSPEGEVWLWLGDDALYELLPWAAKEGWTVGFLPHPEMARSLRAFRIPEQLTSALEALTEAETAQSADLLYCNEQLVLGSVMMGHPSLMKPASLVDESVWCKFKNLWLMTANISKNCLLPFECQTAKETDIHTAALGVTLVYRPGNSEFTKRVVGETEKDEPMLHAVILAPTSIVQVLHFLFTKVLPRDVRARKTLPDYVGYVKTEHIDIHGGDALQFSVDGETLQADKVSVRVEADVLAVRNARLPEKDTSKELKETVKIQRLPKGQAVKELINRRLPWIHHADQEELRETFVTLKENAQTSESYLVLMILAALLSTVGLFANSAPVIIGAMILAPLMSPIISFSMGVLRQSSELIVASGKTLMAGVGVSLLFGTLLTLMIPLQIINSEIGARLSPNLLDLGVAILSGIAGAYASARHEVAKSLAGVAIAVALVPPLSVAAIGIGWWDWQVFWGAFLLFLTNLVGIILAASATFLFLGFSAFHVAKKGLILSLAVAAVISIPLVFAFGSLVQEQKVVYTLEGARLEGVELRDVRIRSNNPLVISSRLLSDQAMTVQDVDAVKAAIEQRLHQPVQLEATTAVIR